MRLPIQAEPVDRSARDWSPSLRAVQGDAAASATVADRSGDAVPLNTAVAVGLVTVRNTCGTRTREGICWEVR